jgi:23S rRNA U2552 (ribose-2'-O)-methylase RlmE/FtsJ
VLTNNTKNMVKVMIQVVAVHIDGSKITKVKTDDGEEMTVEQVRKAIDRGQWVVASDERGNVTGIGKRDETSIITNPDDSLLNNLQHLPKF